MERIALGPLCQDPVQGQRQHHPGRYAARHAHQRGSKYYPNYVPTARAQRQTNSELVGSPRHCVGHHAVESDRGQNERQPDEDAENPGCQVRLLPFCLVRDPGRQVLDPVVGLLIRVNGGQLAASEIMLSFPPATFE